MTGFQFDKKKATGFAPIPDGNYECIIESGVVKTAGTGTKYIDFKLKVRDDVVDQSYGGRVLFAKLFFTENTEGMVHGFLDAIGTPEGQAFNSADGGVTSIKDYAVGKAVLAKVAITVYEGNERNEVKYMNASKVGGGKVDDPFGNGDVNNPQRAEEDPFSKGSGPIQVSDDDLPF